MRRHEGWRALIRETRLSADQLVLPLFVRPGRSVRAPIPAMPGQFQLSVDQLIKECQAVRQAGVPAVLLFGLSDRKKDARGSGAYATDGIIQQAARALKAAVPELLVITDVCLCAYTSHGHCGIVKAVQSSALRVRNRRGAARRQLTTHNSQLTTRRQVWIDEAATREALVKVAVSHAQAGADMVAPSDMMDGSVGAIRQALDAAGYDRIPILAYAAKFASALYAPFRTAVDSAPAFGDRRSYQLDVANRDEALRKAAQDLAGGADIVMVKPALGYLDVVRQIKCELRCPTAAFNVSGEYSMVKAAAARGWLSEQATWWEMLLSMKRAGADVLITYWAKDASKFLREQR